MTSTSPAPPPPDVPRRLHARIRAATLSLALLVMAAAPGRAQETAALELLVREAGTARPLADATIRVVSTGQLALTDATGHALLRGVPLGPHEVEIRHQGHAPRTVSLDFAAGMTTQLQVALEVQPIELEGVEVTVEARVARLRRAGFYHRQKVYWGDFLHPEDLVEARRQGTPLSNLLRGRTGISVVPSSMGGYRLVSTRSQGMRPCPVAVIVDGVRQYGGESIDRIVSMMDIEAIEIYGGRLSTPIEFESRATCGAVVIWTQHGR